MSDAITEAVVKPVKKVSTRKPPQKKTKGPDLTAIQEFLGQMDIEVKGTVHVNGQAYSNCVLTVDFGQPLEPVKISPEDEEKLRSLMVETTKAVFNRDVKARVSNDPATNIWWSTVV